MNEQRTIDKKDESYDSIVYVINCHLIQMRQLGNQAS